MKAQENRHFFEGKQICEQEKEDDSNKAISFSSCNPPSSGNDENESENKRNSQQMGTKSLHQSKQSSPKNFMAPTISAASKALSSKKKILAERNEDSPDILRQKPSNLGSKYCSHKVGISNSGSRKSLPKIPSLSSPSFVLESDDNGVEEDDFVPDSSSTKPYDPLTNYLSPRPKFLRYKPNRRREVVLGVEAEDETSISPRFSLDSQGSSVCSTIESSLVLENGEHMHSEVQVVVEEKDDEEEVIEEKNWGLKWELFKFFIVLVVLVLSTIYVSSMNSNLPSDPLARRGLKIDYQNFGNRTFEAVAMMSLEFGACPFVGREEYGKGLFEIDGIGAGLEGKSRYSDQMGYNGFRKFEIDEKMEPLKDSYQMVASFEAEDDSEPFFRTLKDGQVENEAPIIPQAPHQGTEGKDVAWDLMVKVMDELVENEAYMVASHVNEMIDEKIMADFNELMAEPEPKTQDRQLANEAELVADVSKEEVEVDNVPVHVKAWADSEPRSMDELRENESEGITEEPNDIIEMGNVADYGTKKVESESKFIDGLLEQETEIVAENLVNYISEENVTENEHKQFWLTSKNVVWLLISSAMALGVSIPVRLYNKSKKASPKTTSSNVKSCSQSKMVEKSRIRMPSIVVEKLEQSHKADSDLTSSPAIPLKEERLEKTPRIIPKVELLSEFDVEEDFRSSLKSCAMLRQRQESKETHHSVFQERKVLNSKASQSGEAPSHLQSFTEVDSLSHGSYISHENPTKEDVRKDMNKETTPTPLRRSSRIRSRVTSP